ncbi:MAG: ATP-binding protein, partial [bacterium]
MIDVDNRIGHGGTGGSVVVPALMGQEAAMLVLRIFAGEYASQIPITPSEAHGLVFDWRQLQRWGIGEAQLPAGSDIRFREPTMWKQYRAEILAVSAALLAQAALILWLLYEHRRRHNAEVMARNTMSELTQMNRMATAGELSASIAHEVNQPLTGIVTRANAALRWLSADSPDINKARTALTQIVSAGHRASNVITSIRAMFRNETPERSSVDINKIISSVLSILRIDLEKNDVTVQPQLSNRLPTVMGNPVQLQQVILNLMMNGVEAMHSVQPRVLRVKSELNEPGGVHVSVEDSGIGIDPSNFDRIFQPLFTTKASGMGMGLSICHSIIESHNGRI